MSQAEPLLPVAPLLQAAETGGIVAPLTHLGVLHVAGDDAIEFLQNQLTQSVKDLPDDQSCIAAWCNAKGRTRALFRVVHSDTGILLIGNAAVLKAIQPKLQMFILRAQVALTNLSDDESLLGLAGPAAETFLTEIAGTLPTTSGEVSRAGDLHIIALPSATGLRYLLLAPQAEASALQARLMEALTPADDAFWQLLEIQAGIPDVVPETMEQFIPTMMNLEPLGGISYQKGCYPGQEVVARMHYLGRLKRRLYRLEMAGDPPAPGAKIVDANGAEAGSVVIAAAAADGNAELLAVLKIDAAEAGGLTVDELNLTLLNLPYQPPEAA